MKRALLMMFLLLMLAPGMAVPNMAAQDSASWTFIVYIAGDNDLESYVINDLMEMQAVGSSDQVNIIVQVDRADGYEEMQGDWVDTRRYHVEQATGSVSAGDFAITRDDFIGFLRELSPRDFGMDQAEFDSEVAALEAAPQEDLEAVVLSFGTPAGGNAATVGLQLEAIEIVGEINAGDPDDLVTFVRWAIENYPADHYALDLWNHGGGWTGFGWDEGSDNDGLTLPELDQALAQIVAETGIGTFDLIAFDACLMSQVEVHQVLAPYADYALTAEETIPGAGYEYASPLAALVQNPGMSAVELGQAFVDGYMVYYSEVVTSYAAFDLHVVDLSGADALSAALDQFTVAVQNNPAEALRAIGNARNNAQIFGDGTNPDEADFMSSVDLIHFMTLLSSLSNDAAVNAAAQNVILAAQDMVVYSRANDGLPDANGIAIFFPRNIKAYEMGDHDEVYPEQGARALQSWLTFLDTFYGTATETFAAADLSIAIKNVLPNGTSSIYDPPVVLFETNGQGIVNIAFYAALQLDDGVQVLVDASPLEFTVFTAEGEEITEFPQGQSLNEFAWNVEMPVITDGIESAPTVLLLNPDQPDKATVSGIYQRRDGQQTEASLVFDLNTREVVSVWSAQFYDSSPVLAEIKVNRGDYFIPTWRFIDPEGNVVIEPSDTALTFGNDPFTFEFVPADSGDYVLTVLVEDMAGNVSVDSALLSVDNEGLDVGYRGFKDVSFGVNFLYPWAWSDPVVIEDGEGGISLAVSNDDATMSIILDAYEVNDLDTLLDTAFYHVEGLEEVIIYEPALYEIAGYDAYVLDYEYQGEESWSLGSMLVIYVPENNLGYIIDVDGDEDLADETFGVFGTVIGSIIFFEPSE